MFRDDGQFAQSCAHFPSIKVSIVVIMSKPNPTPPPKPCPLKPPPVLPSPPIRRSDTPVLGRNLENAMVFAALADHVEANLSDDESKPAAAVKLESIVKSEPNGVVDMDTDTGSNVGDNTKPVGEVINLTYDTSSESESEYAKPAAKPVLVDVKVKASSKVKAVKASPSVAVMASATSSAKVSPSPKLSPQKRKASKGRGWKTERNHRVRAASDDEYEDMSAIPLAVFNFPPKYERKLVQMVWCPHSREGPGGFRPDLVVFKGNVVLAREFYVLTITARCYVEGGFHDQSDTAAITSFHHTRTASLYRALDVIMSCTKRIKKGDAGDLYHDYRLPYFPVHSGTSLVRRGKNASYLDEFFHTGSISNYHVRFGVF